MALTRLQDAMVGEQSRLKRRITDVAFFTDPEFGGVLGVNTLSAANQNAAAMDAFLRHCADNKVGGAIPAGDLYLTPVDVLDVVGDVEIVCNATIINQAGAAATQRLLLVDGNGSGKIKWCGGRFDANGGAFSCLEIRDWDEGDAYIDEASGISCTPASSSSTSALVFSNVRKGRASWGYMNDMDEGTSTQGSIPRCFTAQVSDAVRADCDVHIGRCEDVHGIVVVGNMAGGVVNTYGGAVRNAADNGIYNVGNASVVNCYDINVDGIDELFVNSGTGVLNAYRPFMRNASNAVGLQNCEAVNIFAGDLEFSSGVAPFKTRVDNTASGAFRIYNSRVKCRPSSRILDFGTFGSLQEFIDIGNRWEVEIDDAIQTTATIVAMTPGSRCRVESGSDWIFVDALGGTATTDILLINIPIVTEASRWDRAPICMFSQSAAGVRINGARQQLMTFSGQFSVNNIQSEREANFPGKTTAPPREVWGTAAPTVGYWQQGSRVWNISATAAGTLGWVCVAAGTPGTWKVFGSIAA